MNFNPRSPCGERLAVGIAVPRYGISIHAPLAGSDNAAIHCDLAAFDFNPRSPCGERLIASASTPNRSSISIHAPLAGSDCFCCEKQGADAFQSTLPLRGATFAPPPLHPRRTYFNPRSPCGERLPRLALSASAALFQSTLPLRGATSASVSGTRCRRFQSTLPLRGATWLGEIMRYAPGDFNPRSPCGERPQPLVVELRADISIHAPLAGSDAEVQHAAPARGISIHAPLAGSDSSRYRWKVGVKSFQSTLPLRGATTAWGDELFYLDISIHAPLAGSDPRRLWYNSGGDISIHAPLAGSDLAPRPPSARGRYFNPRSPCGERLIAPPISALPNKFQSTLPLRGALNFSNPLCRNGFET